MYSELSRIYKEVGAELGLSEDEVKDAYASSWEYIRKTISSMPFQKNKNMTLEEFRALQPCFNIPNLGKMGCTYKYYTTLNEVIK